MYQIPENAHPALNLFDEKIFLVVKQLVQIFSLFEATLK